MGKKIGIKKGELSFEDALAKLEQTVDDLEDGGIPLADALARYEQGIKHLKTCYAMLQHAQQRIEILSGVDAEGNPIAEPFGAEESPRAAAGPRSEKRSDRISKAAPGDGGDAVLEESDPEENDIDENDIDENDIDDSGRLF